MNILNIKFKNYLTRNKIYNEIDFDKYFVFFLYKDIKKNIY